MHKAHTPDSERLRHRIGSEPLQTLLRQSVSFNQGLYICLSLCRAVVAVHCTGSYLGSLNAEAVMVDPAGNVSFSTDQPIKSCKPVDLKSRQYHDTPLLSEWSLRLLETSEGIDNHCLDLLKCLFEQADIAASAIEQQLLQLYQGRHLDEQVHTEAKALVDIQKMGLLDRLSDDQHMAVYLFHHYQYEQNLLVKHIKHNSFGYSTLKQLAKVQGPHLAKVYGVNRTSSGFIVIMDYFPGGDASLRFNSPQLVSGKQTLALADFLLLARQLVAGLEAAHKDGVLHGNLDLNSLYFDESDHLFVADFGIAANKLSLVQSPHRRQDSTDIRHPKKRHWYAVLEEPLSEVTDIFGCGLIFYQWLIGDEPRWRNGVFQQGRLFTELPDPLRRLIEKMLALKPSMRYQTMEEVKRALGDIVADTQVQTDSPQKPNSLRLTDPENPTGEKKKLLLFLLLVLFFVIGVNTGILLVEL